MFWFFVETCKNCGFERLPEVVEEWQNIRGAHAEGRY